MEDKCAYWLYSVRGIGDKSIHKLLQQLESAEHVYYAEEKEFHGILTQKQIQGIVTSKKQWNLEEEYGKLEQNKIHFVHWKHNDYPMRLKQIPDSPYGVCFKGKLPEEGMTSVAVIGARECSEYGRYIAKELGKELGNHKIQVISGMAKGIDGIVQKAVLDAGGTSFGVLGCSVDICYPAQNRGLYEELGERGGVLSAYPLGTQPKASLFPPRNRIVSGLADTLVVIEARQKSGTLITVDMALEQGKEVYAVPGRVTDRLSDGCNKLIKQGAGVFLSPEDFLGEIGWFYKESKKADRECEAVSNVVLECMDFYPQPLESIYEKVSSQYSYAEVIEILMCLCMEGRVVQVGNSHFSKVQP